MRSEEGNQQELFTVEEATIEIAQRTLADASNQENPLLPEFRQLLDGYRRLYGQIRHLIKISDRQQRRLTELNDSLEQRNRFIRETFGRYTSDEVADTILDSCEEIQIDGVKRHISILMADLRGFTATSERLPPEDVVGIVNNFLEGMTDPILDHGGTIIDFNGDSVLAIFGAPVAQVDHAVQAVGCAVEMQRAMKDVNLRNLERGYPRVSMGIGINTGDAVVGSIGSRKRMKFQVTGRHANLASRIQSYATGGQVLISGSTAEACASPLRIDQKLKISAKGVDHPLTIYDVGGVGPPVNVCLPRESEGGRYRPGNPLHTRIWRVKDKHDAGRPSLGRMTELWRTGARVTTDVPFEQFADLRMVLLDHCGEPIPGEIYAKVTDAGAEQSEGAIVTFTSLPPGASAIVQYLAGLCGNHDQNHDEAVRPSSP